MRLFVLVIPVVHGAIVARAPPAEAGQTQGDRAMARRSNAKTLEESIIERGIQTGEIGWIKMPPQLESNPPLFVVTRWEDELSPWLERRFQLQASQDMSAQPFTRPNLLYDAEILPTEQRLSLEQEPLARRRDATVFAVEDGDFIVKYQSNCRFQTESVTDIERDFWFMEFLEDLNVSPIAIFLSPAVRLTPFRTPKTMFDMDDEAYLECAARPDSYVRYMVMERAPVVFEDYFDDSSMSAVDRLITALEMAIDVIRALELVHEMGVVHGDIHAGNIVRLSSGDFGLIDFGKAFFDADETSDDDSFNTSCLLSHWNLEGHRLAFRDDVYKTLLAASFLAVPGAQDRCIALEETGWDEELIALHSSEFLFGVGALADAIPDAEERVGVQENLRAALDLARQVSSVHERPDYTEIVQHITEALNVLIFK